MANDVSVRHPNLLEAVRWLAAGSPTVFAIANIPLQLLPFIDKLTALGAVQPGESLSVVTCHGCDIDHIAEVEFDPTTQRSFHFCPEAGRIDLDDKCLATLCFDPLWVVHWLIGELPPGQDRDTCAVIPSRAWCVGEFILDAEVTRLTLLVGAVDEEALSTIADIMRSWPIVDVEVVITTSFIGSRFAQTDPRVRLLELRRITTADAEVMTLDINRLKQWVGCWTRGAKRPKHDVPGRPSQKSRSIAIYGARRHRGESLLGPTLEAKAIRAEWQRCFPSDIVPTQRTIERHIQEHRRNRTDNP